MLLVFFTQPSFNRLTLSASVFLVWIFAKYYQHLSEHLGYQKAVRSVELKSQASVQTTIEQIKNVLLIEPATPGGHRWRSITHIVDNQAHEVLSAELPVVSFMQQIDIQLEVRASRDTDGTTVSISFFCPYGTLPRSHALAFKRTTDQIRNSLQPHTVPDNLSIEPKATTVESLAEVTVTDTESNVSADNFGEGVRLKIPEKTVKSRLWDNSKN